MPTAIVVDGAFFIRRFRSCFPNLDSNDPKDIAWGLTYLAGWHIALKSGAELPGQHLEPKDFHPEETDQLYRVFFYDCAPLTKKVHRPVSKRSLDLSKTETALFRIAVHEHLTTVRKVALRLGRLNDDFIWRPKPEAMKKWLADAAKFEPEDADFELDVVQKGVDMRLGLDVASMAFKRQVTQIILVAADADFVPAVKLARREGIDIVLDPMGGSAAHDLLLHVDGIRHCRFAGQKEA
ncbi:NYN domain-containing protein [Sphingobium sp. AN641]|uniref:NYN domain-containing protein n=1 Tax=Sphingobium sp. AN641 TaxID=3133443 RepID=UPI0030C21670